MREIPMAFLMALLWVFGFFCLMAFLELGGTPGYSWTAEEFALPVGLLILTLFVLWLRDRVKGK